MNTNLVERDGHRLLVADASGPLIGRAQDALDLITLAWEQDATIVVVPVERFVPEFFRLRSLLAGEFIGKFANYRAKLAILGDISDKTAESDSLRDFVRECNRGTSIFFLPDLEALIAKLTALAGRIG